MNTSRTPCILCGKDAGIWLSHDGKKMATCHHMNQEKHLGTSYTWDLETGLPFVALNPMHSNIVKLFEKGYARDMRGIPGEFLEYQCGIKAIKAMKIADVLGEGGGIYPWAHSKEKDGYFISICALRTGNQVSGVQFRSFLLDCEDASSGNNNIRTLGQNGIYVPPMEHKNYKAIVVHEGSWGAAAQLYDAYNYTRCSIGAMAVSSASTKPGVLKGVCESVAPGLPIFFMGDSDEAGWAQRYRARGIGINISLPPVSEGKDYRELDEEDRYAELQDIVNRHLADRDALGGTAIPLNDKETLLRCYGSMLTEFGIADRFILRYGDRIKYIDKWKKWAFFNGKYWEVESQKVKLLMQKTITLLKDESIYYKDPK